MERNESARWINVVVGVWLFVSAFLWVHNPAQMTNTWVVGLIAAGCALIAMRVPQIRIVNLLVSLWLLVSVWALPTSMRGTFWNNLVAAVVMFLAVVTPSTTEPGGRREPIHVRTH